MGTNGCSEGYGDMLVGLTTFVEAYMEDVKQQQEENDQEEEEDEWDLEKFAKCEEYNPDENADDANQGAWENYQFFVGPTCTEEGTDIKLELFTDEYCSQTSEEIAFEDISNGWTLPYSTGGLVSTSCSTCTEYNDDGEAEIKDICQKTYEDAALKCEEGMEYYSYYGQNVQGCETIAEISPRPREETEERSSDGLFLLWSLLVLPDTLSGGARRSLPPSKLLSSCSTPGFTNLLCSTMSNTSMSQSCCCNRCFL